MTGENTNFDGKVTKSNFYKKKKLFSRYDIDVGKILISKKEPYGKKTLCIKHHQMVVLSLLNDLIPIRQGLLRLIIIIY